MAREKDKAKPTARLTDVEVEEASMVDRAANKRTFLIVKSADGATKPVTTEPVALAKWSVEYVNLLADEAFLYVEAGGEKDDKGLTKPLSLRHFPAKDAEGKVDAVHLREVIESITKSDLPDEIKGKCLAAAEGLLAEIEVESTTEEPVEKRGAKMAKDRLSRFEAAIVALGKILGELKDAQEALEGTEKVAKSADDDVDLAQKVAELETQLAELGKCLAETESRAAEASTTIAKREAEIATQKTALAKQAEMLAAARAPARPNSADPTGEVPASPPGFRWGNDLSNRDSAPKGAQRTQG